MIFKPIFLEGAYLIEPERRSDERGFFARTWCARELADHGLNTDIAQCNTSHSSSKGTLRGMHYQRPPFQEDKIVSCIRGAIFDVVIDLRVDSETYMRWFGVHLSEENGYMIYVPKGFAHGVQTLEDETRISYLVTSTYAPAAEAGLRFDDPAFNIEWPLPVSVISSKDRLWPRFTNDDPRQVVAAM